MSPGARTLRIVIDTNVLFSATALTRDTPPARVLDLARAGRIEAYSSSFILGELEKNLRNKAAWDDERLGALRKSLKGILKIIEPASRLSVIKNADADNRILECAVDANADVLVTGNMKDLRPLEGFQGIAILTPREFLDKYSTF